MTELAQTDIDSLFGEVSDIPAEDNSTDAERQLSRCFRVVSVEPENNRIVKTNGAWQPKVEAYYWLAVNKHLGYNCYIEELFQIMHTAADIEAAKKAGQDLARWKIVVHKGQYMPS